MDIDDVPWVTALLTIWMGGLYLLSPTLDTGAKYVFLAPWMHGGFGHFANNVALFVVLGGWAERRVGSIPFLVFVVLIPYIALHGPVVVGVGELSWGASGLTNGLTAYVIPALLIALAEKLEGIADGEFGWLEVAVGLAVLLAITFLTADAWVTVERFLGWKPRPGRVSVEAHLAGLVLGLLWFFYRAWQHGLNEA